MNVITFLQQPQSITVSAGSMATFYCLVSSAAVGVERPALVPGITYQDIILTDTAPSFVLNPNYAYNLTIQTQQKTVLIEGPSGSALNISFISDDTLYFFHQSIGETFLKVGETATITTDNNNLKMTIVHYKNLQVAIANSTLVPSVPPFFKTDFLWYKNNTPQYPVNSNAYFIQNVQPLTDHNSKVHVVVTALSSNSPSPTFTTINSITSSPAFLYVASTPTATPAATPTAPPVTTETPLPTRVPTGTPTLTPTLTPTFNPLDTIPFWYQTTTTPKLSNYYVAAATASINGTALFVTPRSQVQQFGANYSASVGGVINLQGCTNIQVLSVPSSKLNYVEVFPENNQLRFVNFSDCNLTSLPPVLGQIIFSKDDFNLDLRFNKLASGVVEDLLTKALQLLTPGYNNMYKSIALQGVEIYRQNGELISSKELNSISPTSYNFLEELKARGINIINFPPQKPTIQINTKFNGIWYFDGDLNNDESNPTLTLKRGRTYLFKYVFKIQGGDLNFKTLDGQGYTSGVMTTPNYSVEFTVPANAPDKLTYHNAPGWTNSVGNINIIDDVEVPLTPTPTAPNGSGTPIPTPTKTPFATPFPTRTPFATQVPTRTPTPTRTPMKTPLPTPFPTNTSPTKTPFATPLPTRTPTPTRTPMKTPLPTMPTRTPTPTRTPMKTPLPTMPTRTPTPTRTPMKTPFPTSTPHPTPTIAQPDNKLENLYLVSYNTQGTYKINSNRTSTKIGNYNLSSSRGLALNGDNTELYFTYHTAGTLIGNDTLAKINIATGSMTILAGGFIDATKVCCPRAFNGKIYILDRGSNQIKCYNENDQSLSVIATGGSGILTTSYGMTTTLDPDKLYVSSRTRNIIYEVTISTGVIRVLVGQLTSGTTNGSFSVARFANPGDITTNVNGYIYVTELNGSIRVVDPFAKTVRSLAQLRCSSICCDWSNDDVYVVEYISHSLIRLRRTSFLATPTKEIITKVYPASEGIIFKN